MEACKTKESEGNGEAVKKAKATPDLVADAEERRNSMTAIIVAELILSRPERRQ